MPSEMARGCACALHKYLFSSIHHLSSMLGLGSMQEEVTSIVAEKLGTVVMDAATLAATVETDEEDEAPDDEAPDDEALDDWRRDVLVRALDIASRRLRDAILGSDARDATHRAFMSICAYMRTYLSALLREVEAMPYREANRIALARVAAMVRPGRRGEACVQLSGFPTLS